MILIFLGAALVILGLYLYFFPQFSFKDEVEPDQQMIERVKRNSVIQTFIGAVVLVVALVLQFYK